MTVWFCHIKPYDFDIKYDSNIEFFLLLNFISLNIFFINNNILSNLNTSNDIYRLIIIYEHFFYVCGNFNVK